jgi:DNA-binding response OmpR family regulator
MNHAMKHGGAGATILVVDDDQQILSLLKAILEERGHTVFLAGEGNSALELLGRQPGIDVVITDIMMPMKEGIGLIRAIRRGNRKIKIIAITSVTNHEAVLHTAMEFGADDAIRKPFDIEKLADRVDSLFITGSVAK